MITQFLVSSKVKVLLLFITLFCFVTTQNEKPKDTKADTNSIQLKAARKEMNKSLQDTKNKVKELRTECNKKSNHKRT